ncbi:MAG TPA: class I SAM-dependent methyltransferase [Anaerolineales bacterium]|nr:class I SAM-dependent methyltransferase [Anaerolineales bacterium]
MTDASAIIQNLLLANPLREPTLRTIIQSLQLPTGSRGLDAGCGIGLQTLLLAEAVGTAGHITGLDVLHELLAYGEEMVAKAGLAAQVTFRAGDVGCLPFEEDSFDWVWSADCIGYPAGELTPLLKELLRVVKPGGSVILLGWSSQQLLPGYPLLEARLNANCSGYIPFFQGKTPESNFMRALSAFRETDFESIEAKTFAGDIRGPLRPEECTALISLFGMLWGTPQPEVSAQDWVMYKRLCTPGSADFILDMPEYYGFFTYSMFRGKVSKK